MARTATQDRIGEGLWLFESGRPGPAVAISFGVHGDERPPIDAGLALAGELEKDARPLRRGRVLLVFGNPRAASEGTRWSKGGIDLNRCFHADVLARTPELHEEHRSREIVAALGRSQVEVLVDFHCTVEPGRRFLMHHPPVEEPEHRRIRELLSAEVLLSDPELHFGSVSLDEWMSTRSKVGICYETGWMNDPENTPERVLSEMKNLLRGLELLAGDARSYAEKQLLELDSLVRCDGEGFAWRAGVGENLQALAAGTKIGAYADGRQVVLERDATLIFPKKKPELVQRGKPLVYLARRR